MSALLAEIRDHLDGDEGSWACPDWALVGGLLPPPPALPLDLLSRPLAEFIADQARSVSAPPDYVFGGCLGAAGGLIGATRRVSPWLDWEEYPNVWVVNAGEPSANKSPAYGPIISVLRDLEKEAAEDFGTTRRQFEAAKVTATAIRQKWEDEAKQAAKGGGFAPIMPEAAQDPEEPKPPRIAIADATPESLAGLFKSNPRGLLLSMDELSGWLANMERYGGDNSPFWLERWGGLPVMVDRVKNGTTYAERGLLSVFGGIQPERLAELLLKSRSDDGMMARFLVIYPDAVPRQRPERAADRAFLRRVFSRLHTLEFAVSDTGAQVPKVVPLAPAAADQFEEWWQHNKIATEAAPVGAKFYRGFLGKGPGLVLKLALILEFLDWASEPRREPETVSLRSVVSACALFEDYFAPMAARLHGGVGRTREEMAAETLLRHFRAMGEGQPLQEPVNARDLQRARLPGLVNSEATMDALNVLAEAGWVRFVKQEGRQRGRPASRWAVNPLLWSR